MKNNKPNRRDETHLSLRVTKKQRGEINAAAKKCGVSPSEYIRQRALGYAPRAALPDAFFVCCERLDRLTRPPFSKDVNSAALTVLTELNRILTEEVSKWRPQDSGP